jgi:hypothetical protein
MLMPFPPPPAAALIRSGNPISSAAEMNASRSPVCVTEGATETPWARANSRAEIITKAEQIGSTRFVAIDAQGRRTPVQKIDGAWQRQQTLPPRTPAPDQVIDDESARRVAREATVMRSSAEPMQPAAENRSTSERAAAKVDAEAERTATLARLEAALLDRYVIKRAPVTVGDVTIGRTEYRFRGDTTRVAFTESTFRLATDTNSSSVARSMVDVAEARNWKALRVSGSEDFKRLVWLEATVRGVKTIGYEPSPTDLDLVKREREARALNRIELARGEASVGAAAPADKASGHGARQEGGAGRNRGNPHRQARARGPPRGRVGRRGREAGPAYQPGPGDQGEGL